MAELLLSVEINNLSFRISDVKGCGQQVDIVDAVCYVILLRHVSVCVSKCKQEHTASQWQSLRADEFRYLTFSCVNGQ